MDADELVRRLSALLGRPPPLRSVADADGPAFAQVLMVCMGNVCRSPMARAVTQTTAQRAAPGDGAGTDPRQAAFFDAAGKGDGVFNDGAKLRFNKKHRLELSDNLENPLPVVGVHLDPQ